MARFIVHYLVQNDVVTDVENEWTRFHQRFNHNKISKALETFKKCLEREQARWQRFNTINNDVNNSADVRVLYKDHRGVFKYYFEASELE